MKVSLIIVVLNRKETLSHTLESILAQSHNNIECIVVDGGSTDGSIDVIRKYEVRFNGRLRWISEPDQGLYDAMNKGIKMASGELVAIINSDDFYHRSDIISKVVREFVTTDIQGVYGDVSYVSRKDVTHTVRYYSSKRFTQNWFRFGFLPAHPSFFTYKKYYEMWGYFKPEYKIAGDFELLLRFIKVHKLRTKYLELDFLKMRAGGVSTSSFSNTIIANQEIRRACRENSISTSYPLIYLKYLLKIFQLTPFIHLRNLSHRE